MSNTTAVTIQPGNKVNTPLGTGTVVAEEMFKRGMYGRVNGKLDFTQWHSFGSDYPSGRYIVKLDNPENWAIKGSDPAFWLKEIQQI